MNLLGLVFFIGLIWPGYDVPASRFMDLGFKKLAHVSAISGREFGFQRDLTVEGLGAGRINAVGRQTAEVVWVEELGGRGPLLAALNGLLICSGPRKDGSMTCSIKGVRSDTAEVLSCGNVLVFFRRDAWAARGADVICDLVPRLHDGAHSP